MRVVAAGQVTAEDMQDVRERRAELLARNERATATWEIASGRAFKMTHQPMQEGWLTTYEEVTDQRASEATDGSSRASRRAHRPAQPRAVPSEARACAGVCAAMVAAWRCSAWTSTSSRLSTTRWVTPPATNSRSSKGASSVSSGPDSSLVSVAMNSLSFCHGWRSRPPPPRLPRPHALIEAPYHISRPSLRLGTSIGICREPGRTASCRPDPQATRTPPCTGRGQTAAAPTRIFTPR